MKIALYVIPSLLIALSCGRQDSSESSRTLSLTEACRDVAKARAELMLVFIDAFSMRIRQENDDLRSQGQFACSGALILTDSNNQYDPPKGSFEVTVASPSSSSIGSYGFPGSSPLGSMGSGSSSSNGKLVFSIKTSVTFTLGNTTSYKCQSIYNHPFYTSEAAKLVNQPAFNEQLKVACG